MLPLESVSESAESWPFMPAAYASWCSPGVPRRLLLLLLGLKCDGLGAIAMGAVLGTALGVAIV